MEDDKFVISRALDYYARQMKEAAETAGADGRSATARFMDTEYQKAVLAREHLLQSMGLSNIFPTR